MLENPSRKRGRTISQTETITVDWIAAEEVRSDLIPDASNTRSFGSSLLRWLKGWFGSLDVTGTVSAGEVSTTNGVSFAADGNAAIGNDGVRLGDMHFLGSLYAYATTAINWVSSGGNNWALNRDSSWGGSANRTFQLVDSQTTSTVDIYGWDVTQVNITFDQGPVADPGTLSTTWTFRRQRGTKKVEIEIPEYIIVGTVGSVYHISSGIIPTGFNVYTSCRMPMAIQDGGGSFRGAIEIQPTGIYIGVNDSVGAFSGALGTGWPAQYITYYSFESS